MTKKFTAVILSLAIAFTLAFASVTGAFAADSGEKTLTVKTTSNLFSSSSATVSSDQNQVRVTFELDAAMDVLNVEGEIIYDPAVLTPVESEATADKVLPVFAEGSTALNGGSDLYSLKYGEDDSRRVLAFNATEPGLFKFTDGPKVFATVLFDVNGGASVDETTVELWIEILGTAQLGSGKLFNESTACYPIDNNGQVFSDVCAKVIESATSSVTALPVKTPTTPTTPDNPDNPTTPDNPDNPSILYGDANSDNVVDISDATAIQKYIAQITELTDTQKLAADVDGSGYIDITDATTIQKFVAQIITVFPVESGK